MRVRVVGITFLFVAMAFTGWVSARAEPPKKPTDSEITKLIVGKWAVDEGGDNEPKIKGTMHYKKDGTVEANATIEIGKNPPLKVTVSGTWKAMDGVIVATVTKTNVPDLIKEGFVSKDTVISIDDKEFKYKSEQGKERTEKRIKE
jgi:hypothetical protein